MTYMQCMYAKATRSRSPGIGSRRATARRRARPLRSTCPPPPPLGLHRLRAAGRRAAAAAASTAKRAEVASGRAASAARLVYLNAGITSRAKRTDSPS